MRKIKKCILGIFIALLSLEAAIADDYTLSKVDDKFIGTYIPVDVDNQLKKTKLFYKALELGYPIHHDVLFLGKNKCYCDAGFHDGYAVNTKEFSNFRFVENDNGYFCLDDKGNSYKKISDKLNERGYGYDYYRDYILDILFDFSKDMSNLQIKNHKLILDDVEYEINLDGTFFDSKDVAIWLYNDRGSFALVKNGLNGELHKSRRGEEFFNYVDKEVIKEFPLMFLSADKEFPAYWNLPKNQIRYLRNLIYARHGYIFKNEELNDFFRKFNWYKPNPDFTEAELNREEKNYIDRLPSQENE
ncbi:MAG: YARHG domain-containing protein [Treponema sp.]|nr:YARHG domain-containing protein [Treponema sp.]